MVRLARKNESISDKIVRFYKEGYSIEEIARALEMPKDNVPRILEKHMPDYASYQPGAENNNEEKAKKSSRGSGFSSLLGIGKKDKPAEPVPAKLAINLEMDENGFIDRNAANIAGLLQKGKSDADVAEFFSRDLSDVRAVKECMDEHFRRLDNGSPQEETDTTTVTEETEDRPSYSRINPYTSGLEEDQPVKPVYTPPTYNKRNDPKPVSASYGLASDPAQMVESEKVALVEDSVKEEPVHEVKLVPDDADFSQPVIKPGPIPSSSNADSDEDIPEMPSIEPVSLDALDKELTKAPDPVPYIPDIGYEEKSESVVVDEDAGLSPMEKMKKFAQMQIELNNKKIDELNSKKADAENVAFDCNTNVENFRKQMEEYNKQADKYNKQAEEFNEKINDYNKQADDFLEQAKDVDKQAQQLQEQLDELNAQSAQLKEKADEAKGKANSVREEATEIISKAQAAQKQAEDAQPVFRKLIEDKNKAGEIVSGINEEIENIKKEISDYRSYL